MRFTSSCRAGVEAQFYLQLLLYQGTAPRVYNDLRASIRRLIPAPRGRAASAGTSRLRHLRDYPRRNKKRIHEGPRRTTKAAKELEKAQEGSAKGWEGRKDFDQGR